jgi:DNA-binding transcriptional LysR family regulator
VNVSLSNANVDFVKEEFDMAVRIGHVADSRLVARPLHKATFRVVASPHYLRRHGVPSRPEDLRRHSCLGLRLPDSGRTMPWVFAVEGDSREIDIGPRMIFDHPLGVLGAALHDGGLARLLDFTVDEDIMHGRLTEALVDHQVPALQVFAVYPLGRQVTARVSAFFDFLIEHGESDVSPAL